MTSIRIGFLGFNRITALDLVGPAEVFSTVPDDPERTGPAPYEVLTIGVNGRAFTTDSGLFFRAPWTLETAPALDTLIVPGGAGLRDPRISARVADWVKARAGRIRRVVSVCTGIYGLAPSGLLDGRRVTTHWKFAADVERRFPRLHVEPNALFVKDGRFYTSAGVTSGIDLALALVEEDFGPQVSLAVARMLVVYLKRAGGQEQYSEPLRFQTRSEDRFSELAAWMAGHLHEDLSIDMLATRACVSGRQFNRRFKRVFGTTPAAFVEDLRLNESRRLLSSGTSPVEAVAETVGFRSSDSFRRAFERRFGITPTGYRSRFGINRLAS
jgi:transcriptional regulator GlxA family with amidase domain